MNNDLEVKEEIKAKRPIISGKKPPKGALKQRTIAEVSQVEDHDSDFLDSEDNTGPGNRTT